MAEDYKKEQDLADEALDTVTGGIVDSPQTNARSLGAMLASAAAAAGKADGSVTTFQAPGMDAAADRGVDSGTGAEPTVRHHFTSGDMVHKAGPRGLTGKS
ncbi:MAG: hypothetical protein AAF479_07545 [Pseudomonadota bacterium]